jgi:hypothetical protein
MYIRPAPNAAPPRNSVALFTTTSEELLLYAEQDVNQKTDLSGSEDGA